MVSAKLAICSIEQCHLADFEVYLLGLKGSDRTQVQQTTGLERLCVLTQLMSELERVHVPSQL